MQPPLSGTYHLSKILNHKGHMNVIRTGQFHSIFNGGPPLDWMHKNIIEKTLKKYFKMGENHCFWAHPSRGSDDSMGMKLRPQVVSNKIFLTQMVSSQVDPIIGPTRAAVNIPGYINYVEQLHSRQIGLDVSCQKKNK